MKLDDLIASLSPGDQEKLLQQVQEYKDAVEREKCQGSFMAYVKRMWPGFIHGRHHAVMAKKFEEIASGKLKRLIINLGPRHTKSEFASYLFPSWFLGRFPQKKVIQSSNTADLAVNFGRKVRNLVQSEEYAKVFPGVALRQDSKSAGRWATSHDGEYFAIGVGGTMTGKGADLLIIDDPHSEQEAALAVGNPAVFDSVFEWYTSGPRQRLQPGGAIVVVMCMTGDTRVLMASGKQKLLRDIRPGDHVATFDKGRLTTSKINNWRSNGVDQVYKVQTQSGIILRANERHPFLVLNEGVCEWTRLKQLQVGDELVALKDAVDRHEPKTNLGFAARACQRLATTAKTQMHRIGLWGITASGNLLDVLRKGAPAQPEHKVCAQHTTTRRDGLTDTEGTITHLSTVAPSASKVGTASLLTNMHRWLQNAATDVMFAGKSLHLKTLAHTGAASCVLTTATAQEKCEGSCATIATLQSDTERRQAFSNELRRISDFTTDRIVSITPCGFEEVFDVEVDRTENFIANGVVSHNTRWSKADLTGKILKGAGELGKEDEWEVIELPAIMPSGKPLWPEFWSLKELEALREELPPAKWNAQYQQNPTAEEGALIKRDWWQIWEQEKPPKCEFLIQSWDTAFTKKEKSDYSACTTWGIFHKDEDPENTNIILLDAFQKRMEFPELKDKAIENYREWEPDAFIVEAKAAGAPLVYELRKMGIPVSEYTPSRGTRAAPNDKISRVNSVTDLFRSGKIWAPDTRWARELVEQCAAFPNGDHDDLVDSTVQALLRFRQGGFLRLDTDERDEIQGFRRKGGFY
jgi:predicted phage terminase large subunit-like protein